MGDNRHGTYCSLRAKSPYPDIQGLWPSGPALVRIEYDMLQYHKTPKSQWLNIIKIYLSIIKSLVLVRWPSLPYNDSEIQAATSCGSVILICGLQCYCFKLKGGLGEANAFPPASAPKLLPLFYRSELSQGTNLCPREPGK